MDNTLTKEIIARAIADTVLNMLENYNFDFSELINTECAEIANEIHNVLNKYSLYTEHGFDEKIDFKAIEDIVRIYEEHGYTGGSIHDFD